MRILVFVLLSLTTLCGCSAQSPYRKAQTSGAYFSQNMQTIAASFNPMESAPRDGTVIEVINTYGLAPTFALVKFKNNSWLVLPERSEFQQMEMEGPTLRWRAYAGTVEKYVDPTHGLQNDQQYWMGAFCAKYGYPLNCEEPKHPRVPIQRATPPR